MNTMNCIYCQYEWNSRVENPKACPRCKYRLDYQRKRTANEIKTPDQL